ncbi:MAG: Lrp/AsnC family transcriptional regulator [Sphaerochaetaceae bacterium]|nr:Lrp/AsnC family transcriptional regulator [Sphaerochaetaceae bacterium]
MKLDETNKVIIRKLNDDGRKPFSQIAQEIGVTENTVRARVNQMIRENILTISAEVDPQAVPEMQIVIMGIKLKTMDLEKKAKEFSQLKGVISSVVVTGRYDLIVHLVTSNEEDRSLLNFFKNELSKISDVSDVETFVVYQSHNFRVPYLL